MSSNNETMCTLISGKCEFILKKLIKNFDLLSQKRAVESDMQIYRDSISNLP